MADKYSAIASFAGSTWHMQSARIGAINYGGCLTVGVNSAGLHLSVMLPFRVGHPPLLIPLGEVRGKEEKGWVFRHVNLAIGEPAVTHMRIAKGLADRIVEASGGVWKYEPV